uniref:eEF1A lysine and N-terminal methyltransferase n=1 Tax=Ciona savignyi TaxID=51511 RepID=H2YI45_CIOSA
MNLLPKVSSEFSSSKYWEDFFKKRTRSFEWYGNYLELCGILHRYMKEKDDILVIGCGNSDLSSQIYSAGFKKLTNIDISKTVIKQMTNRHADKQEMKWMEMDVTKMGFDDGHYSVVLDKGTLDAMMSDDSCDVTIDSMFAEIDRVLRTGGRYICITLAQDHVIRKILEYFPPNNYLVRIHKVWTSTAEQTTEMPVFAFVLTKFMKLPSKIIEVCFDDSTKPTRVESESEAIEMVKSQQYYAMLKNQLSNNEASSDVPAIQLFTNQVHQARYTMHVVDLKDHHPAQKFGIFIIPQGREMEWLFTSVVGRLQVAKSARFMRLVFVALNRNHKYVDMQAIQDELSTKVMELAPPKLSSTYKVPFVTVGDNVGERNVRYQSGGSGGIIVENYVGDAGVWYRQLIFDDKQSQIQSVVRLKKKPGDGVVGNSSSRRTIKHSILAGKKRKSKSDLFPDASHLASNYSQIMVAGLTSVMWVSFLVNEPSDEFRVLIIGLGGGTLSLYLLHCFPHCHVTAVELDPEIATVAQEWFGLSNPTFEGRLQINVGDGFEFVRNLAMENQDSAILFDMVAIDANCNDPSQSLICPPQVFISDVFLTSVIEVLKENGGLFLNVLCRDPSTKTGVIKSLKEFFPQIYKAECHEDVNEVMLCFGEQANDELMKRKIMTWLDKGNSWEKQLKSSVPDFEITSFLHNLTIV